MQQVEFVSFEFSFNFSRGRVIGVIRVPVWSERDFCHALLSSVPLLG